MTATAWTSSEPARSPIASRRHTAAVVVFFLLLTAAGALFQRSAAGPAAAAPHPNVTGLYLSLIAAEWALVYWVRAGLRLTATPLRNVIDERLVIGPALAPSTLRASARRFGADALIAAGVWSGWTGFALARDHWLTPGASSVASLLPQGPVEAILWIALSISAGFCEELLFRGYLQQQFRALTGSLPLAVTMQALLFGVAHGYQGLAPTISIAAYAMLLGAVAARRGSVRPGMIAHAWTDIFSGLLAR